MIPRKGKQITYGFFYLLVIVGLGIGFYSMFLKSSPTCFDGAKNQGEENIDCGGPCDSCETAALSILIGEKGYFSISRLGKTTFYLEFKNPSGEFWVKNFDYTLNVFDSLGSKIGSFSGSSSIAPSGKRIVAIVAADVDAKNIARTDLGVMSPEWSPLVEYHVDGVTATDVRSQIVTGGKAYVSGVITNNVSLVAKKVTVTAVFRNKESRIVNASITTIDSLGPFSKKNFEIFLTPDQIAVLDLAKTEIAIEVTR